MSSQVSSHTQLEKQFLGKAAQLLPLMQDQSVTDILINGPKSLFVEKGGRLTAIPSPFEEKQSILDFIERMLIPIGKRVDAASPYVDGRLLDGSRFNILLPPIAVNGPLISIRKNRSYSDVKMDSFSEPEVIEFLKERVKSRKNILIAGGTGTGKTTLLSCLIDLVSPDERIALIEETKEIYATHPHLVSLEARSASPEGKGEVSLRTLVKNALRMRPDRIILGECRGQEAFDMVQAMNTGHAGSMGTIHANGALDGLKRLETLVLLAGFDVPMKAVRSWVASCVDVVVFIERTAEGRKIKEVITVQGMEGEVYRISPRYSLKK